ncbi:hypothetical protein TSMEX_010749 [Taenia solium]|eukprot:TsM_000303500 transcript=TsM_000303500 gene=TsM_000303500
MLAAHCQANIVNVCKFLITNNQSADSSLTVTP